MMGSDQSIARTHGTNVDTLLALNPGITDPNVIEPLQVIVIALVAMAIALLSTLYPSWRAAATQPAEALRYE